MLLQQLFVLSALLPQLPTAVGIVAASHGQIYLIQLLRVALT